MLEQILDEGKPPLGEAAGLHWLLAAPFRYPPLQHGSRFGTRYDRGIFYGSESEQLLKAEAAFYCFKFFEDILDPLPHPVRRDFTVIEVSVATEQMLDVSLLEDCGTLTDPLSWAAGQALGSPAREAGIEVIRYPSARVQRSLGREQEDCNVAVLAPAALASGGVPSLVSSYGTITDRNGVRIQDMFQPTLYFPAEALQGRPWSE